MVIQYNTSTDTLIGTQMTKLRKLARRVTYRGSTRPEIRLLLLTVLCTHWGRGVLTDESIIHMTQDAFLPVEGIGLVSHVPGLHGAPLPEKRHDRLHLGVAPVDGVSCVYRMFNSATADRSGRAFVSAALCCFNLVLSDLRLSYIGGCATAVWSKRLVEKQVLVNLQAKMSTSPSHTGLYSIIMLVLLKSKTRYA